MPQSFNRPSLPAEKLAVATTRNQETTPATHAVQAKALEPRPVVVRTESVMPINPGQVVLVAPTLKKEHGGHTQAPETLPISSTGAEATTTVNPAQNLSNSSASVATAAKTSEDSEEVLVAGIRKLWTAQTKGKSSISNLRNKMKTDRSELSKQLAIFKKVYAGVGREGRWGEFLRELSIPRSTADRYVLQYEREQSPTAKLLSEELSQPTADQITALAKKLKPRLLAVLTTAESVPQFLTELAAILQMSSRTP